MTANWWFGAFRSRGFAEQLVWGMTAGVMTVLSGVCLREWEVPLLWRVGLAIAPIVPSLFYMRAVVRWIRGLDELERRVHLEAAAFSFPALVLLAVFVSLLRKGGFLVGFVWEWESLFVAMFALYVIGYVNARRAYQ